MKPVAENPLHKAADFIRSLDADAAAAMLGRLSAEEATALRTAIRELNDEGPKTPPPKTQSDDGTVELQLNTSEPEAEPRRPTVIPPPAREELLDGAAWLRSLRNADPQAIATYLSQEQPRAIAVVLGYLPAELAAGVLQCLDAEEQSRVVAQLAEQRDADPDSLRVIATGLSAWVERQQEEQERRTNRVATIRQILAATPASQRRQIIAGLTESDPQVAASLADTVPAAPEKRPELPRPRDKQTPPKPQHAPAPAIPFEQLERLDGRALAEALGRLDSRTALLALAAAPDALVRRLTNGLPRAAAKDLRHRIHRVGPTTLSEIDRAQAALARSAGQIAASRRAARAASPSVGA